MKQIFHIFRKDVRHHWIEILLCQAALVAYCWDEVHGWRERPSFSISTLSTTIHVLLPLTWSFFIVRNVQDESLVGDRQFWITRPYQWRKLLAEKMLLVLVFLNLPLIIAQVVLLTKAGFSPAPHILGLLWMQVVLLQLPFLPLFALAVVTRNLAQALLAVLAVLLFIIVNVALDAFLHSRGLSSGDTDWILSSVLVIACCAAIGLQYARRKTAQSRVWLAGGGLAMIVITVASAYATRGTERYPLPAEPTSFHAAVAAVKLTVPKEPPEKDEDVELTVPIRAWGLAPGSLGRIRGVRLILEAPDGRRWDSGWQGYYELLGPGENLWRQSFTLKYKDYEHLKSTSLRARVSVAVAILREHEFERITAGPGEFVVPRVGRCHLRERQSSTLFCHSALVKPLMVVLRTDSSQSTCPVLEDDRRTPPEGIQVAWESGRDSDLPDYGVSPVVSFSFYLPQGAICPGTPLGFSFPEFVQNGRSDFEIDNMNLDEYRRPSFRASGFGIMLR